MELMQKAKTIYISLKQKTCQGREKKNKIFKLGMQHTVYDAVPRERHA